MASPMNPIRQCTKDGCRNLTRPSRFKVSDYPGTLDRLGGGVCGACYEIGDMPCTGCGVQLRPSYVPAAAAPERKQRHPGNMCERCYRVDHPKPIQEPVLLSPGQVEQTKRGLESFLNRRRERLERFAS